MEILLTWVGSRDPVWDNPRTKAQQRGPVLSLLQERRFDVVYLLLNLDRRGEFARRATQVQRACSRQLPDLIVRQVPVDLVSVIDYREVFRVMNDVTQRVIAEAGLENDFFVYLSPGTPQMQTAWILLAQAGLIPATMLDSTPPDLVAPGQRTWREVDLTLEDFPQVVSPGETARLVGILKAQNENLEIENLRLRAEVETLRIEGPIVHGETFDPDFNLRQYLLAQERSLYLQAMSQADGNAAAAARLLGIAAPAFRARAHTLGVRLRQRLVHGPIA